MKLILILLFIMLGSQSGLAQGVAYHQRLKIKDLNGAEVFSVKSYPDKLKIEIAQITLVAPLLLDADQNRAYSDLEGDVKYQVSHSKRGFFVFNLSGQQLCKLEFSGESFVVSSGVRYRFETEDKTKIQIFEKDKLIAEVKWYSGNSKLKLKDPSGKELFVAKAINPSASIGILACGRLDQVIQAIVIAELDSLEE